MATWTIPRTWTAGETVTAANMNTHVRDNELAITGAWISWTPAVTQGVSITLTNTGSRYTRIGRTIIGYFNLVVTNTGTAANAIAISPPFASSATAALIEVGVGAIRDSSGTPATWAGSVFMGSTTNFDFRYAASTADDNRLGVVGFTAALASGDAIRGCFTYEAATD